MRLHAEVFGREDDPAVVLVAGLAQQVTWWRMGFVHAIVVGGYRVIRFDNRDIGLSGRTPGGKVNLAAVEFGDADTAPYTLETMADDTLQLLDDLRIDRAHMIGYSLGGMVAQAMAAKHPQRVTSLVSMMSSTGAPDVGRPTPEGERVLYAPLPAAPERAIAQLIADRTLWSTPPFDEATDTAAWIRYEYHRGYDTAGVGRQIAALRASGDRTPSLAAVAAPTLVIHGTADPLIDVSGGRATAAAIPGARLVEFPGLAHDLPQGLWPQLLREIHTHLESAS